MHRRSVLATKKRLIGYIERKSSMSFYTPGDRKQSRVAALDSSIHGSVRRSDDGLMARQGSLSASIHDGSVNIDAAAAAADADLGCSRNSVDESTIRVYGRRYTITPSTANGSSSNLVILQRQSSTIVPNNNKETFTL